MPNYPTQFRACIEGVQIFRGIVADLDQGKLFWIEYRYVYVGEFPMNKLWRVNN
jgi:hypothetical protein